MGVDISSKTNPAALLNRVIQAQTQAAKAVESQNPAAIDTATTQATSQVGQALTQDSFDPASQAQSDWDSSYAASAPSLSGTAATPSAPAVPAVPAPPAPSAPMQFTPQQLTEIGQKVGDFYASGANPTPPMQFTPQQLHQIGTDVGNNIAESQDVCSSDHSQTSGFDKNSTVIQQSNNTDCGAAAVATLRSSKPDQTDKSSQDMEQDLDKNFSGPHGTTPEQMADMLAHVGLKVTNSSKDLDRTALNSALQSGGKAVAMVDSNAINPSSKDQGPGSAHWVTIEGMNKDGAYQVKDPATGRSYYVSPEKLQQAISTVRSSTNTGGILTVRNPEGAVDPQSEAQLAQQSTPEASQIGDAPGTGSDWRSSFGRESS